MDATLAIVSTNHEDIEASSSTINTNVPGIEKDFSPGGSIYYYPIVKKELYMEEGQLFDSIDECEYRYLSYAEEGGFSVRKESLKKKSCGLVTFRFMACTKSGHAKSAEYNSLDVGKKKRKCTTQKVDCPAYARFRFNVQLNKYELYQFEKKHNHKLFDFRNMYLSKNKRKLDYTDEKFIHALRACNIGPTKAYSLRTAMMGGCDKVRGTKVDYKNCSRDLTLHIGDNDADLTVNRMIIRQENVQNFSFYKLVSDTFELNGLFWADATAKANYIEFGDMVSFDATYSTNKYSMVFVPFTGIDNHKHSVTFGAGLLYNETAESYKWLLSRFLEAFGKEPNIIVTDQDPAMRKAVKSVFKTARHRLCMWHIGKKLKDKIPSHVQGTNFKKRWYSLVYNNNIDRETFDTMWLELMDEFQLRDHPWFSIMFRKKARWIPAYFKDIPLAGLMRTTSRSESENSFFGSFLNNNLDLLSFTSSFEAAMEKQRNTQYLNDHKAESNLPVLQTPLRIEKHASIIYTTNIFKIVQQEIIDSIWLCSHNSVTQEGDLDICLVKDEKNISFKKIYEGCDDSDGDDEDTVEIIERVTYYKVTMNTTVNTINCSCNMYLHQGVFCRHIFYMLKLKKVEKIPKDYILRRWEKGIVSSEQLQERYWYGYSGSESNKLVEDAYSIFQECVEMASDDKEALRYLIKQVGDVKAYMKENPPIKEAKTKAERKEKLIGVSKSAVATIHNPTNIRTKGCGSQKRLKGAKEKAIERAAKDPRECSYCERYAHHDYRNCPTRKEDERLEKEKEHKHKRNKDTSD